MPLRLIEATVPNEELEKVPGLLDEIRVIHLWTSGWASEPGPEPELASESASGSRPTSRSADATGLVRVLVDADSDASS
ncbi:MAG TPA: hypothetical protein VFD74_00135, partial [Thermoleophilia bacterium]|nr:hypothetical protein [Thermoleophilia bacterium]